MQQIPRVTVKRLQKPGRGALLDDKAILTNDQAKAESLPAESQGVSETPDQQKTRKRLKHRQKGKVMPHEKNVYLQSGEDRRKQGVDRMRFELGDTMVEGEQETSALCNEEYEAIIAAKKTWKRAKLAALESIMRRFGMEVNDDSPDR